jgi:cysteinyl-tRNA synthetase
MVLGIFDFDESATVDSQTQDLIQARTERVERNWRLADKLRREILARVSVQDSKLDRG